MSDDKELKKYPVTLVRGELRLGTGHTKDSHEVIDYQDHLAIVAELKNEMAAIRAQGYNDWRMDLKRAKETIARQARELEVSKAVIEKLKTMVSHYETCATVDCYDDEEVDCDCGLAKELAAIEGAEGEKE